MPKIATNRKLAFAGTVTLMLPAFAASAHADSYQVEHTFLHEVEGGLPSMGLTLGADGRLYGIGAWRPGCSTYACYWVFQFDKDTHDFEEFHVFKTKRNISPSTPLVLGASGFLHGASKSGTATAGLLYKIPPAGHAQKITFEFQDGDEGNSPNALINNGRNTHLLGAAAGGQFGKGVVYDVTERGVLQVIYAFKGGSDGSFPGHLVSDSRGNLYGATQKDGVNFGTIFKIPRGGTKSIIYTFRGGADGTEASSLLRAPSGDLYGTTYFGGSGP